jgi:hypothetical protein
MNQVDVPSKGRSKEIRSWTILLVVSVAAFFAPMIVKAVLENTMTQKQRENRERYNEEVRKQGIK